MFLRSRSTVLILLILAIYAYLSLFYPFSFNFEVEINEHYYLVFGAVVFSLLYIFSRWMDNVDLAPLQGVLYFVVLFSFGYAAVFDQALLSNEPLCVFFSLLLITIPFMNDDARLSDQIWTGLLIFYVVQLLCGLYQIIFNTYGANVCKGSFRNSGIYTIYITLHLPVVAFYLKTCLSPQKRALSGAIYILTIALTVLIIAVNESRTGVLMITVFFFLSFTPIAYKTLTTKRRIKVALFSGIIAVISLILFVFLFSVKIPSMHGRLLMLEVTHKHLLKNIWFGVGFGHFSLHYPYWQEIYFRSVPVVPQSYLLSAGETYIILNVYVLLLAEIGVIGCLILTGLLVYFFRYKPKQRPLFIAMNKRVALMILTAGFTSYPLYVSPIIFICLLCFFSVLNYESILKSIKLRFLYSKKLHAAALAVIFLFIFPKVRAVYTWQRLRNSNSITHAEVVQRYKALYPQMKNDSKFLTEYGEALLSETGSCKEAFFVFGQAMQKQITRRLLNNSANACKCMGKYREAIENYRFLSYMLPSRFTPKYEMAMLYLEMKDTVKAKQVAEQILEMPVKIPSTEVERIRTAAKTIICTAP